MHKMARGFQIGNVRLGGKAPLTFVDEVKIRGRDTSVRVYTKAGDIQSS